MNRKLWPLFAVVFLDHLAINTPFMVFAFFNLDSHLFSAATSYATRSHWFGLNLAWMNLVTILASPILGCLSDCLGRKRLLLFAATGTTLAGLFCAHAILYTSLFFFFLGRFFSGICTRTEPFALASIADITEKNQRTVYIGYLQLLIAISAVIGPLVGGYLTTFQFARLNYSAPYLFAFMLGSIALIIGGLYFRETQIVKNKTSSVTFSALLRHQKTRGLLLLLFLTQFTWSMYYQFIQVILKQQYHFTPTHLGFFMSLLGLWIALVSGFAIKPLEKIFPITRLLKIGVGFLFLGNAITIVTITLLHITWPLWFSAIFVAGGNLLAYCIILSELSNSWATDQGKIIGVCYSIALGTWAVTGALGGFLLPIKIYLPLLTGIFVLAFTLKRFKRVRR